MLRVWHSGSGAQSCLTGEERPLLIGSGAQIRHRRNRETVFGSVSVLLFYNINLQDRRQEACVRGRNTHMLSIAKIIPHKTQCIIW